MVAKNKTEAVGLENMQLIPIRAILAKTTAELWDILTGEFAILFEDGATVATNYKDVLYSSYAWDLFREAPHVMVPSSCLLSRVLDGKPLGSRAHLDLLGVCMWTVHDSSENQTVDLRDYLCSRVYEITNLMYNDLSHRLEAYVTSLDILDYIECLDHPDIRKVKEDALESYKNSPIAKHNRRDPHMNGVIDNVNSTVINTIKKSPTLDLNPLARAVRSGLVKEGQVKQTVGIRGFVTDIDSNLFRHPVMYGFAEGLRKFHDNFIDSRSAAKALAMSQAPLQDTEYFSRRLQLITQNVQRLHHGDCGSTDYMHWTVRGREIDPVSGEIIHGGDLPLLVGKYYVDDANNLRVVHKRDRHLIGTTLRLRSVHHCRHPDPYGICSTCFGELSLSVPENTNIGQLCATAAAQQSSQSVLSVKHLDGSAAVDWIMLSDVDKAYLKVSSDGDSYLFADQLQGKKAWLVLPAKAATNLTDLDRVRHVEDLSISRITELLDIGMVVQEGDAEISIVIPVSQNRRKASLTYAFLNHIKRVRWSVDESGNYRIPLEGFDWSKPVMTLPLKHFNMSDHSKEIQEKLESNISEEKTRDKLVNPDVFLVEFSDLVNSKLFVNVAVLEVIMYGAMIVSAENKDYRLPKPWTDRGLGVMETTMDMRSLSASMAYEGHYDVLLSPISYIKRDRGEHPMDALIMPYEVSQYAKNNKGKYY